MVQSNLGFLKIPAIKSATKVTDTRTVMGIQWLLGTSDYQLFLRLIRKHEQFNRLPILWCSNDRQKTHHRREQPCVCYKRCVSCCRRSHTIHTKTTHDWLLRSSPCRSISDPSVDGSTEEISTWIRFNYRWFQHRHELWWDCRTVCVALSRSLDTETQGRCWISQRWCSSCHPVQRELWGSAVNLELFYVLIALIMVFFFYRRHLLYLLQDKKETLQMLVIFALVACLVYLICDYLLDVMPNNIR